MPSRRKSLSSRIVWIFIGCGCALAVGGYLFLSNPLNWFVERSENFSESAFMAIQPGGSIAAAIDTLGPPIATRPVGMLAIDCDQCRQYVFLGNAPTWLPSFQEAWIIATSSGEIVTRVWNEEP